MKRPEIVPEMPRPEKDSREEWIERACKAYEYYKKKRIYYDFSGEIFKFLKFEGLINFAPERKNQIAADYIAERCEKLAEGLKTAENDRERQHIQTRIDDLVSGKTDIKLKLKQYALNVYFKELLQSEGELSLILQQKQSA